MRLKYFRIRFPFQQDFKFGKPALAIGIVTALFLFGGSTCWAIKIEKGHSLDFHGYFRMGAGMSEDGATQAEFQTPGARSKYRLGNEANTNYEFAFDYRYALNDKDMPDGAYIQGYLMVDDFEPHGESSELGLDGMPQLYLNFANFFKPGLNLWAGRRYYDRKDIHMNDHYWLNVGQGAHVGAGVEGIDLGLSKLKIAFFRMEDSNVAGLGSLSGNTGTLNSSSLDVRLAKIKTNPKGKVTLWGQWMIRHKNAALGFDAKDGFGLGFWHDQSDIFGCCSNTVAFLYRNGAALVQGDFNARPAREDQGYDLDSTEVWEFNNNFLMEPNDFFSMQWAIIVRSENFGLQGISGDTVVWYSTGIRPIFYLTDHVNIAVELGIDYVDDEINNRQGSVRKSTLALQLARSRGYYSRPVLRAFVTYANWSDDFKGLVGASPDSAPYGNQTNGWTYGVQAEVWW